MDHSKHVMFVWWNFLRAHWITEKEQCSSRPIHILFVTDILHFNLPAFCKGMRVHMQLEYVGITIRSIAQKPGMQPSVNDVPNNRSAAKSLRI